MGYVDKLIAWAGRHPYLSVAGLLVTLFGGGMALGQLYKSKDSDKTAATAVIAADSPQTPAPAPIVAAANATVKEEYQFSPDIKVIGSKGSVKLAFATIPCQNSFAGLAPKDISL